MDFHVFVVLQGWIFMSCWIYPTGTGGNTMTMYRLWSFPLKEGSGVHQDNY